MSLNVDAMVAKLDEMENKNMELAVEKGRLKATMGKVREVFNESVEDGDNCFYVDKALDILEGKDGR